MAASSALTVLLFSLVFCTHAMDQQSPLGQRSKRNTLASMISFLTSMESRLAAVEAKLNNSMEERLAQLEAKTEGDLQEKLQAMQDSMQRLESMMKVMEENLTSCCPGMSADKLDNLNNCATEVRDPPRYIRTCQTYYEEGQRTSGVYRLQLQDGQGPVEVFCNMSNGAGWAVLQRRVDGTVDFYRNWTSYEEGFGDLFREFWLGNRIIHSLTSAGLTQLRVDLQAWNGSTAFASYSHFSVGDASSSYRLSVSGYSGTAGNSLAYHSGRKFSTHDQDHDADISGNCAQSNKGAWWYEACTHANLNGEYGTRGSSGIQYVAWNHWLGMQSLQRTELKLK